MKRALVVLALLAWASVASAKTLVIVHRVVGGAAGEGEQDLTAGVIAGEFNKRGASWSQISSSATKTLWAGTGQVPRANGIDQYDAVVHLNFWVGQGAGNYRPDSIGKVGKWPTVPQVFIGRAYPGAVFNQSAACSTGVTSGTNFFDEPRSRYTQYVIGKPYAWSRSSPFNIGLARASGGAIPAGIWRPIVAMAPSQRVRPTGTDGVGGVHCVACDSIGRSPTDSVLLWVRYRSASEPAPLIYVQNIGGAGYPNETLIRIALAIADSASGGKVFDNPRRTTFRRSIVVRRAFGRNKYDLNNGPQHGGMFCYADSCDSVNVKAGIDSLESLAADPLGLSPGLRIGVGVNVDSIASYPYELRWWRRLTEARFILDSNSQVGDAAPGNCINPFGSSLNAGDNVARARTLIPANAAALPTACGSDTSIYCLLVSGMNLMRYWFGDKVDPSVIPAGGDWTPTSMVATNSPGGDSLDWVIYHAGFRTVVIGETPSYVNVNRHWVGVGSLAGLMTLHRGWSMDTYGRGIRTAPGTASPRVGYVTRVSLRQHTSTFTSGWIDAHDLNNEGLGNLTGAIVPYGVGHSFQDNFAGCDGMMLTEMELGGYGQGTVPGRRAWWIIKNAVHQGWAANSFEPPGKVIEEWVYPSQLVPEGGPR